MEILGVTIGSTRRVVVKGETSVFDPNFGYDCDYVSLNVLIPIIGYNIYKENECPQFHTITVLGFIPIFGFPVSCWYPSNT